MIVFKKLSWKNFLSTGNQPNTLILNKSSTTLVIGKNGEGKSTCLDALCFALFNKPFRNINKSQMVNSINQKNTVVEIEFSIGSKEYKIVRGIKPNVFEIWLNGEMVNQDAASRDYQKILEQQILKLNYKTFTQVVILGSASFVPFMQLSPLQRREVIEDILDIRIFSTMNQLLKEKQNATKDEITRVESEITLAKQRVESQSAIIKTLSTAKEESINAILGKIASNEETIRTTNLLISGITDQVTNLREKISSRDELDSNIEKAKHLRSKLSSKVEECENNKVFFDQNHVCPSCTQEIGEDHKVKVLGEIHKRIFEDNKKVEELESVLSKLNSQLQEVNSITKMVADKTIELSTHNSAVTILNRQNSEMRSEIENAKTDTGNINEEKTKLRQLAQDALNNITRKGDLDSDKELQDVAGALLKDTGIKTAIIREYLPVMNKLINQYLNQMDSYIHFELDESFNEKIRSRFRDEFTYASFSEGEKMRIDLAILFTWRQIAKMKNSVNTNLLLLDEIFDSSLDTNGTDYFLSLMDTLGEKSNVFVISHKGDQLFDKFRSVIKFEKRNDFSVII
jgi:DNA repair exonuclease SbcCD ATPase subunit